MNLILAHGFLGFRMLLGINYFNGVKAFLEETFPDMHLLVPAVNPIGRIEERGQQLRAAIDRALEQGDLDKDQKIHIIAHSMGGLDARFCVSPGNPNTMASLVTSLTTIATPHRGTPLADVLTANNLLNRVHRTIPSFAQGLRQVMHDLDLSVSGLQDLTTAAMARFNQQYPNHPDVRYFAYTGGGRAGDKPACTLLRATHGLITLRTGEENDGIVAVGSAEWGEGSLEVWPGDHADIIGHDLDGGLTTVPEHFDHLLAYRGIVERLLSL